MNNKNTSILFASHQARKTKAQKTSFIQLVSSAAADAGFMSNVENTKNGARNIVVGNINTASVVYTAHYDTAAKSLLPTFIFPKAGILTTLYQIAIGLLMLVPSAVLFMLSALVLPLITVPAAISVLVGIVLAAAAFIACLYFFLSGPAAQNNANANTSGVATLFEIMADIPEEYRSQVAFVFFDGSINGLVGSADFAKKHKHLNKKLFVNFDCIGVGSHFVVAQSRSAAKFTTAIEAAFTSTGTIKTEVISGANKLPSDHKNFKCAIGVSAFEEKGNTLMLTIKNNDDDTVCSDENVAYAVSAGINLAKFILTPDEISAEETLMPAEEIAAETLESNEEAAEEETEEITETEEISVTEGEEAVDDEAVEK